MASLNLACVVSLSLFISNYGYPDGAPDSSDICNSMKPNHYNQKNNASSGIREPLSTKPYFSIHIDKNSLSPGQDVEVKIQADEFYFEGFILQARNALDNSTNKRFGTFKPHNEDAKLICNGAGITHSKHFKWNNITFSWIAPQETTDKIKFIATVVRGYSTYFMNVQSEVVMISSTSPANLSLILLIAAVLTKWM